MDLAKLPLVNEPQEAWVGRFVAAMNALSLEDLEEFRGTSFPGSPYEGQLYYHQTYDELFTYDASRSKWLGQTSFPVLVSQTSWLTMLYGRHGAGITGSATTGHPVQFPATIVGYSHRIGTPASGNFEIHVNGSSVASLPHSGAHYESSAVNIDLAKGDVVSVYNAGSTVSSAIVQMLVRRKGT